MPTKEKHTKTSRKRALEVLKKGGLDIELPEEDVIIDADSSFKDTLDRVKKGPKQ